MFAVELFIDVIHFGTSRLAEEALSETETYRGYACTTDDRHCKHVPKRSKLVHASLKALFKSRTTNIIVKVSQEKTL